MVRRPTLIYVEVACLTRRVSLIPDKRLSLRVEYEQYGPNITSDRLIQLSAITIDKNTMDFHKAEKTVVLDEPDIEIQVCSGSRGLHGATCS